ncbi:fimbrial protein [Rahnella woolbedingensis]|uniref:Fimbrial-type adhesion domain-containing protein n=1 Tax=Rahnella woolbedingensis TaxID=1510574 RepID=A0A419N1X3_9GAMM|nr:fimbrial protein [Rahnella woolbedingensis]RJT32579.1 hypothetical protein D6C13_24495 [Rahnella woolbedingensis]
MSITKRLGCCLAIMTGLLLSAYAANAATLQCYRSAAKDSNSWNHDFGNMLISDTDNVSGVIKNNIASFNMTGSAKLWCDCSSSAKLYFSASMNAPENGDGWYTIDNYMDAKISININGSYLDIPYQDASTGSKSGSYCNKQNTIGGIPTGGAGRLSLKITHPFTGQVLLPQQVIAQECITSGKTGVACTPANAAYTYSFTGNVVAPQNCTVNAGTQLVVNLGTLYSEDFKTKGQKPNNYTEKTFVVPIQCNGIDAAANLTLRIQGTASTGVTEALQSDNSDVGVVITNETGDPLIPNDVNSHISFDLDDSFKSNVTLHAYPVGTTGNAPAEGTFTTLAYLRVDFA